MQSIAIVGAGAMGCLFAAKLTQARRRVVLIDVDQNRLDILNRNGLTFESDSGTATIAVQACKAAEYFASVDVVLIFTKGMHTKAAAQSVSHLASPTTWAITLQNGIGNAEAIADVFTADRTLIGATDYPADLKNPTKVSSHGQGTIRLGAFADAPWPAVEMAMTLFRDAGFNAVADSEVMTAVWEKLAFNAALNALATITGMTVGGLDTPAGRRIAFAIVDEVVATAAKKGLALHRDRITERIEYAFAHHCEHKASMLQDRLAGRPTEIENINGAIARVAADAGIGTPVNAVIADLVRLIELSR